ncbi:unnamed protein product [Rangifer tarandus platyrhynchus]|uniref:Uncharacterized protein n=1 Tax=Rangifer tarandus platyrhynchus TaxID=3082113 RepID=A0ABN8ZWN2_RANTA|nr:unnamed protein product [Rangifer tarandus platyrhynchus]
MARGAREASPGGGECRGLFDSGQGAAEWLPLTHPPAFGEVFSLLPSSSGINPGLGRHEMVPGATPNLPALSPRSCACRPDRRGQSRVLRQRPQLPALPSRARFPKRLGLPGLPPRPSVPKVSFFSGSVASYGSWRVLLPAASAPLRAESAGQAAAALRSRGSRSSRLPRGARHVSLNTCQSEASSVAAASPLRTWGARVLPGLRAPRASLPSLRLVLHHMRRVLVACRLHRGSSPLSSGSVFSWSPATLTRPGGAHSRTRGRITAAGLCAVLGAVFGLTCRTVAGRERREALASTRPLRPLGEVEAAASAPQLHRPEACLFALSPEDGRSALT